MKSFKQYLTLNEVFILGDKKPKKGDTIIAYQKWVWIVNEDNFDEHMDDIVKKLKINYNISDIYDLEQYVTQEENPDIIAGTIGNGNILDINSYNWRHSSASKTLEKTIKALKLNGVMMNFWNDDDDDDSVFVGREEFTIPLAKKTFYHGTSYAAITGGILSKGIMPSPGKTNFKDIRHEDKVFITLNQEKALFHAKTAAQSSGSFPIIISLTIPDVDKLVMDYDVAISFYGDNSDAAIRLGFSDISKFAKRGNKYAAIANSKPLNDVMKRQRTGNKAEDLNTKLGVFGYVGRIAASNFTDIFIDEFAFETWYANNEIFGSGMELSELTFRSVRDWHGVPAKKFLKYRDDVEEEINDQYAEDEEEE